MIELVIDGTPTTQGSKSINRRTGQMFEQAKGLRVWRETIAKTTMACRRGRGPFEGPVFVSAVFLFARPKRRPRRSYPLRDLDKLQRALGDGLVAGGLLVDDSQITQWLAEKRFTANGEVPGVRVRISEAG